MAKEQKQHELDNMHNNKKKRCHFIYPSTREQNAMQIAANSLLWQPFDSKRCFLCSMLINHHSWNASYRVLTGTMLWSESHWSLLWWSPSFLWKTLQEWVFIVRSWIANYALDIDHPPKVHRNTPIVKQLRRGSVIWLEFLNPTPMPQENILMSCQCYIEMVDSVGTFDIDICSRSIIHHGGLRKSLPSGKSHTLCHPSHYTIFEHISYEHTAQQGEDSLWHKMNWTPLQHKVQ